MAVNPIFSAALAAFSSPSIQSMERTVNVPVKAVALDLPGANPLDPETWRTAVPTDAQLISAVHALIERHAVELDEITTNIITNGRA